MPDGSSADEPNRPDTAPLPPWAVNIVRANNGVPSLQELTSHALARNLHQLDSLNDLPEHLSALVRGAIQRDRRLLKDDSISVWLSAAIDSGTARRLNLRWASSITDDALRTLAAQASWAAVLDQLDLGFCENIGDAGIQLLMPSTRGLTTLMLTGCTRCGDAACIAIGRFLPELERLEIELLQQVTDHGLQAVVRGCPRLCELRAGGCSKLTSISTSLIADHCAPRLRRLGLGGIPTLTDIDLEEVGRCNGLQWLELCACPKLSDSGLKSIGKLAERQMKAYARYEEQQRGGGGILKNALGPPPTLTHLDLGGLARVSDEALQKLATRAKHLESLDIRGCVRLSEAGLRALLRDGMMPRLRTLTVLCLPAAANDELLLELERSRPGLVLVR